MQKKVEKIGKSPRKIPEFLPSYSLSAVGWGGGGGILLAPLYYLTDEHIAVGGRCGCAGYAFLGFW